jgi:hypothetical protein
MRVLNDHKQSGINHQKEDMSEVQTLKTRPLHTMGIYTGNNAAGWLVQRIHFGQHQKGIWMYLACFFALDRGICYAALFWMEIAYGDRSRPTMCGI